MPSINKSNGLDKQKALARVLWGGKRACFTGAGSESGDAVRWGRLPHRNRPAGRKVRAPGAVLFRFGILDICACGNLTEVNWAVPLRLGVMYVLISTL